MADPTSTRHRDSSGSGGGGAGAGAGSGPGWRTWLFGIAIVLLAIVVLQNSQSVRFKLLFIVDAEMPLIIGLLIAGALGAVIGYAAPVFRRHHRDVRRRDDER